MKHIHYILIILIATFLSGCEESTDQRNKKAVEILGNPEYLAFSYGGYRHSTRDTVPSISDLKEDLKILSAMGVGILRTYNTSQFEQAANLLEAIKQLKAEDDKFEMYIMLGAWIDCEGAWTNNTNHSGESFENNQKEINTAVELCNKYPDLVKVIAVGNEAMVYWASSYYVTPDIILKWVNHLQNLKNKGGISPDVWITSSDNYAAWGGQPEYHNDDLAALIQAVDYVSLHTYPFHETHYNSHFWITPEQEVGLDKMEKIDLAMQRSIDFARKQYMRAAEYIYHISPDKEIHIGETGWASVDASFYGIDGSRAADEYKQKLFYDHMRSWTNEQGIACFYFEAFDEKWKDAGNAKGSENHFGLITLNGEVKYALWKYFDDGKFNELERGGIKLKRTFNGDTSALWETVLEPPKAKESSKFQITTVCEDREPGEKVTAETLVVSNASLIPDENNGITYPGTVLKLNTWEATCTAELKPDGIIEVKSDSKEWWGCSLELQSDGVGENISDFADGFLHFTIRGDAQTDFQLGFQTGMYNKGNQVNNYVVFGPGKLYKLGETWTNYSVAISEMNKDGNLADVNSLLYLRGENGFNGSILIKDIFYTKE